MDGPPIDRHMILFRENGDWTRESMLNAGVGGGRYFIGISNSLLSGFLQHEKLPSLLRQL